MSNFSDYINSNKINEGLHEKKTKESLQSKIDEYSGFSQDRLMSEFIKLTIEKKKRGELTNDELQSLKNTIVPMLNNEQKIMLDKMLQMVKDVK